MKYLLDTCVLTDLTKKDVNEGLIDWYSQQKEDCLFISVITLLEISKGIELLRQGKKKKKLLSWFDELLDVFEDQVLSIDQSEALLAGKIEAQKKLAGFNFSLADCLIISTALKFGLTVVTRNTKDFKKLDCAILNPWSR